MMDTNIWGKFVDNKLADYAIGGPTVEMFCKSYKDTHPNKYFNSIVLGSTAGGYRLTGTDVANSVTSVSGGSFDELDGIYLKTSNKANGMWMASPSSEGEENIICTCDTDYFITWDPYSGNLMGLRPIVCLKSSVELEKKQNRVYAIKN